MRRLGSLSYLIATLVLSAVLFGAAPVYSQDTRQAPVQAPDGWESYAVRPLIEDVAAQAHDLGANWEALRAAHFSYIAELMGMYPAGTHFYFLARDGELLYDAARLVTEGSGDHERMHLLNISSLNIKSPDLKSYLEQNGLSNETIAAEHDIVFIDTGFRGSVPTKIKQQFDPSLSSRMKTQLIVNDTHDHPSSRAFLSYLNFRVNNQYPGTMRRILAGYEHLARYTDRSTRFLEIDGVWHPLSPIASGEKGEDGAVSRTESVKLMEDLKADWNRPETQKRFHVEKNQVAKIKARLMTDTAESRARLSAEISALPADSHERVLIEAQIRDMLEAKKNIGLTTETSLGDIGIGVPVKIDASSHRTMIISYKARCENSLQ